MYLFLTDYTGATMSQGTSLQAESSRVSEASQDLNTEQSAEDVLAEILGGFAGTSSRSGRQAATPHGMLCTPLKWTDHEQQQDVQVCVCVYI